MDSEGIPKKIYRHIISAVAYFNYKLNTGANLSGIILLVRHFNSKLKTVNDIEITVELGLIKLRALGLITRRNNLFYLDGNDDRTDASEPKPFHPININDDEGEIPLNPESRISTGSTSDLFERIEFKFEGCDVPLEKSINYDY